MHDDITVGDPVLVPLLFIGSDGKLADPTGLSVDVTAPDGTTTTHVPPTASLTNPETGRWVLTVVAAQAGVWSWVATATGGGVAGTKRGTFVAGKSLGDGPCEPWTTPDAIFRLPPLTDIPAGDRDYAKASELVNAASRLLFRLTKQRYPGVCEMTVRPCRRAPAWGARYASPPAWNASWGTCRCGAASLRACGCSTLSEVQLTGEYPIIGVQQVRIDGQVLPPSAYRVDDRSLVRVDGERWPSCQDLAAEPTELDTWDVAVWYGAPAPPDGTVAADHLAAQYYAAWANLDCELPGTVRAKVLQGVSEELISITDLDDGKFGIREVDWFLDSEVKADARKPSVVASPDFLPSARRAGT